MAQPEPHVPYYSTQEATEAAGVGLATLRNWLSRKPQVVLMTEEERENVGHGHPILLSRDRVVQIAITARLVALGWQPRAATEAAIVFSDSSEGPLPGQPARWPGQPFPTGLTFLIAHGGRWAGDEAAELLNITGQEQDALLLVRALMGLKPAAVLDLGAMVKDVERRLAEAKEAR